MVTLPARARLAAMDEQVTIPRPSRSESKDAGRAGHPISFVAFLRYGLLVTFVSLAMSTVYLYARYLV